MPSGIELVSVKGVLLEPGGVIVLRNERDEWELPGGRPEPGENHTACLVREVMEELGLAVCVRQRVDTWQYEVRPGRVVTIVTYGLVRADTAMPRLSEEHVAIDVAPVDQLAQWPMPEGYRQSIRSWQAMVHAGAVNPVGRAV